MKRSETDCARLRRQLRRWIDSGELEQVLPELAGLRGVPQPADYHAEGDVFRHSMLAVAQVADTEAATTAKPKKIKSPLMRRW